MVNERGLITLTEARCKFGNAQSGFLHLREQRKYSSDQLIAGLFLFIPDFLFLTFLGQTFLLILQLPFRLTVGLLFSLAKISG